MSSEKQYNKKFPSQEYLQRNPHQEQQQQQQQENENDTIDNNNEKIPELTAEWCVRAQLTISRPSSSTVIDNNITAFPANRYKDGKDGRESRSNKPVKFVYKWSSDDIKPNTTTEFEQENIKKTDYNRAASEGEGGGGGGGGGNRNEEYKGHFIPKSDSSGKIKNDSFHSNFYGSGKHAPSDSGFSSSFYNLRNDGSGFKPGLGEGGTRCRSTCSIVLSAVTDFLPIFTDLPEEADPFTYNTASYTVSPDKGGDEFNASQNFGGMKILALRDAFSQTSDSETRNLKNSPSYQIIDSDSNRKDLVRDIYDKKDTNKRKLNDNYRFVAQEDVMQSYSLPPEQFIEEGNSKSPFYMASSSNEQNRQHQQQQQNEKKNLNMPSQSYLPQGLGIGGLSAPVAQKSSVGDLSKKQPRTVHIDVYCTGSDAEDDNDDDDGDESSSPSSENLNEMESNSTPQTVLDIEQMLLRHHRASKHELPRKLKVQQSQKCHFQNQNKLHENIGKLSELDHTITKSTTADEISESKQILFKKHIGDQKSKFNLRNKNIFRKDPSDDCLSSNYPNSSRSTMRDLTCSSISSVVASNIYEDAESLWKEAEPDGTTTSIGKSDSFEYDNSIDRFRIKQMERLWSKPEKEHTEYEKYKSNIGIRGSPTKQYFPLNLQHHQNVRLPQINIAKHPQSKDHHQLMQTNYYNPLYSEITNCYLEYPSIIEKDEPSIESDIISNKVLTPPRSFSPHPLHPLLQQKQHQDQDHYEDHHEQYKNQHYLLTSSDNTFGRGYFRHSSSEPRSPDKSMFHNVDFNKSESESSTLQTNLSGYTTEYLAKARKFGTVITALRKPGHHIGPAKNPECQCEHCRRWMAERFQRGCGRGRAFSMSDAFNIKQHYWLQRE